MTIRRFSLRWPLMSVVGVLGLFALAGTSVSAAKLSVADRDADKRPKPDSLETDKKPSEAQESPEVHLSAEAAKRYDIAVGRARKQKLVSHIVVPAQVAFNASAMSVVGCPVQGRVAELKADVGDRVKAGDELLVVESVELGEAQSDFLQKRTAVAAATAAVEPSKSAYERAKSLYESSKGIALTEVQKRELEYSTAKNVLLTAQRATKASQSRLRLLGMTNEAVNRLTQSGDIDPRYHVRAPLAGTVTERAVTLGELVKPDREKLLVVADLTSLWVLADVPESRIGEVKQGANATVSVGEQTVEGTVSLVGVAVDPSTRSVPVRLKVAAEASLKPGMFAQADIISGGGDEPVVVVPASAIQYVDGSTAVFLPVEGRPNSFTRRMVSVGDSAGGLVSVVSGLEGDERVVTSGAFILKAELGKSSARDED